jgi:hypothetical protein
MTLAGAARSGVADQTETEKRPRLSAVDLQERTESHPSPRPVELKWMMAGKRAVEEGREVAVLCRSGGLVG